MAQKYRIAPIKVNGVVKCCGFTVAGITEHEDLLSHPGGGVVIRMLDLGLSDGMAVWGGSPAGGPGGKAFGICCAQSITLRLNGFMSVSRAGQDEISVYLNDALLWSTGADPVKALAWWMHVFGNPPDTPYRSYPYYEGTLGGPDEQFYHEMEIPLESRPCGNIIKVICGLTNSYPLHFLEAEGWNVQMPHLPPIFP